jgi:hypothetical protein
MHAILVIFKKDVRRLWWQIAITLALLAALGHQDSWRADAIPDSLEGWLNLLVPLAWACLIAQVVHEETLVGDREFWMTRPYRWPSLLAAKALFLVLFIHLPLFTADFAIIAARGLSPAAAIPHLLRKQLLLAGGLTVPAVALAAIVRNLMQFVFVAVLAPVMVMFCASSIRAPWLSVDEVRSGSTVLVLGVATVAVVFLQYRWRRSRLARTMAVAGGLLAGVLYAFVPPGYTYVVKAAASPARLPISLQIPPEPIHFNRNGGPDAVGVYLSLTASGIPSNSLYRSQSLSVEVQGSNGAHFQTRPTAVYQPWAKIEFGAGANLIADAGPGPYSYSGLSMTFSRSAFARIRDSRATVSGSLAVQFYQLGQAVRVPVGGSRNVPHMGRCSSMVQEWRYSEALLKVLCESAGGDGIYARVELASPGGEANLAYGTRRPFGNFSPDIAGPRLTWLSPVDRWQTSFQITDNPSNAPGSQWLIPRSALPNLEIVITPELITGYQIVDYRFPDLDLKDYVVKPLLR